eukprot:284814852_2
MRIVLSDSCICVQHCTEVISVSNCTRCVNLFSLWLAREMLEMSDAVRRCQIQRRIVAAILEIPSSLDPKQKAGRQDKFFPEYNYLQNHHQKSLVSFVPILMKVSSRNFTFSVIVESSFSLWLKNVALGVLENVDSKFFRFSVNHPQHQIRSQQCSHLLRARGFPLYHASCNLQDLLG